MMTFSKFPLLAAVLATGLSFLAGQSQAITSNGAIEFSDQNHFTPGAFTSNGTPTFSLPGWENVVDRPQVIVGFTGIRYQQGNTSSITFDFTTDGLAQIFLTTHNNLSVGAGISTFLHLENVTDETEQTIQLTCATNAAASCTSLAPSSDQPGQVPLGTGSLFGTLLAQKNYRLTFYEEGGPTSISQTVLRITDGLSAATVPLPASGLLLAGVFGGIAWRARRKSRA